FTAHINWTMHRVKTELQTTCLDCEKWPVSVESQKAAKISNTRFDLVLLIRSDAADGRFLS
ncbi:MAG: hypothetical protein AAFN76_09860, partial [Pseudomonadota bacterium]